MGTPGEAGPHDGKKRGRRTSVGDSSSERWALAERRPSDSRGPVEAQGPPVVSMADNYFDPIGLAVEPGTTVRFEIASGSHSATAYADRIPDGATAFDSGVISSGNFEYTYEATGTYDYYCSPHRTAGMVGRVVVGDPGGTAEASPIPDGAVPDSETIVAEGSVGADEFEGSDGGRRDRGMGPGGGMTNGGGPGWMLLIPVGFVTTFLGIVGGVVYWASSPGRSEETRSRS